MKSATDKLMNAVKLTESLLSRPVDFAKLEREGILRKVGHSYEVLGDLPEHVAARIKDTSQVRGKTRVNFMSDTEVRRALKATSKLGK
jgi:hypothetical protein